MSVLTIQTHSSVRLTIPTITTIIGIPLLLIGQIARADLTDLRNAGLLNGYNEIRLQSAIANQAVYDQLLAAGCTDAQTGPDTEGPCTGNIYTVWRNVREVVHNANVISNAQLGTQKPTEFTLGRNVGQLGGALQWCNGEEFGSLNSFSTAFVAAQTSSLSARIAALRFGSSGLHANHLSLKDNATLADNELLPLGGGAGADADSDYDKESIASPWSVWSIFGNGSYLKGEKVPTGAEEGFSYKGTSGTLGVDKRLSAHWVMGGMVGYQRQTMTFAPFINNLDVESAKISGYSVQPYALFESEHWYANVSVGYQHVDFNSDRLIHYGTQAGQVVNNPVNHIDSNNSTTRANGFSSYDSLGYSIRPVGALTIEPSLSLEYQNVKIGKFTENAVNDQGFRFVVDEQTVRSLEAIPALRLQYTFTPRFGVWTPYLDAEWHHQFYTDPRTVTATYADVASLLTPDASFQIKTDELDPWYQVYSAGISAVLRGSAARARGDAGGLQIYLNYRRYEGLKNYKQQSYGAGMRYEF